MNDISLNNAPRFRLGSALLLIAWIAVFLVMGDVAVNLLFEYPKDNRVEPNTLQRYFDYGRSTEAKLRRTIGDNEGDEASIVAEGWIGPLSRTATVQAEAINIAVYGSSFADRMGRAARDLAPEKVIRIIGAPAAPLSWSYAAFVEDTKILKPEAAVLTILSQGLGTLSAMTGATANFDIPYPYTQPHYIIPGDNKKPGVKPIEPIIKSLPEMRAALFEREALLKEYIAQLRQYDPYYHELLFKSGWSDHSALLRLARRGFWGWHRRRVEAGLYSAEGFNPEHPVSKLAMALVGSFVRDARKQDILPVIYLVNNYGMDAHLYNLLSDTIDELDVSYISSHTEISPSDPRAYLSDSHFRPDLDKLMAQQVLNEVKKSLDGG